MAVPSRTVGAKNAPRDRRRLVHGSTECLLRAAALRNRPCRRYPRRRAAAHGGGRVRSVDPVMPGSAPPPSRSMSSTKPSAGDLPRPNPSRWPGRLPLRPSQTTLVFPLNRPQKRSVSDRQGPDPPTTALTCNRAERQIGRNRRWISYPFDRLPHQSGVKWCKIRAG